MVTTAAKYWCYEKEEKENYWWEKNELPQRSRWALVGGRQAWQRSLKGREGSRRGSRSHSGSAPSRSYWRGLVGFGKHVQAVLFDGTVVCQKSLWLLLTRAQQAPWHPTDRDTSFRRVTSPVQGSRYQTTNLFLLHANSQVLCKKPEDWMVLCQWSFISCLKLLLLWGQQKLPFTFLRQ